MGSLIRGLLSHPVEPCARRRGQGGGRSRMDRRMGQVPHKEKDTPHRLLWTPGGALPAHP